MADYLLVLSLHILFGVLWAGGAIFAGFFIVPAVVEAGPGGGAVMAGAARRKMHIWMSVFAMISVLAGLRLYMIRLASGGDAMTWVKSPEGLALTFGGILALGGFAIAMAMQRPAAMQLGALGGQIAQAGGKPTPEQIGQMQALQARLGKAARLQAFHLLAALVLMSAHRFLASL